MSLMQKSASEEGQSKLLSLIFFSYSIIHMKKPAFLVFDGIDGSGKSWASRETKQYLLNNRLKENDILLTAEPTKGQYGQKARQMLQSQTDPGSNAKELLNLYISDRKEHLEKEILPALKQGKIVLCDRYKYSTIVYQSVQGLPIQHLIDLHSGMKIPDLVLIFDLDQNIALKRINSSIARKGIEKFEKKEFLQKARESFLLLETLLPNENIKIIDASMPKAKVMEELISVLESL